jgi:dihydropteroate synthase
VRPARATHHCQTRRCGLRIAPAQKRISPARRPPFHAGDGDTLHRRRVRLRVVAWSGAPGLRDNDPFPLWPFRHAIVLPQLAVASGEPRQRALPARVALRPPCAIAAHPRSGTPVMFETSPSLDCGGRRLLLDRPRVMGIVNVTPDSFSDGGAHATLEAAVAHGLRLAEEGADLLDIGGESTRPGAAPVPVEEELRRVVPVIERLAAQTTLPLSVDTFKPEVMRAAVAAGAGMINDVQALRQPGALDAAAQLRVPVVLMHMPADAYAAGSAPGYDDVVGEVHRFLAERIFAAEMAGIDKRRLLVDPGFGFGKSTADNLQLLAQLERFVELGVPVLAGLSRKRSIGELTGREVPEQRVAGSVAAHLLAAQRGAALLRVHDVAATVDALKVWQALMAVPLPRSGATANAIRWPDED